MKDEGVLGLKRVLGLPEVVAIEVGQTVGAGVFAMTGIAIGILFFIGGDMRATASNPMGNRDHKNT